MQVAAAKHARHRLAIQAAEMGCNALAAVNTIGMAQTTCARSVVAIPSPWSILLEPTQMASAPAKLTPSGIQH